MFLAQNLTDAVFLLMPGDLWQLAADIEELVKHGALRPA